MEGPRAQDEQSGLDIAILHREPNPVLQLAAPIWRVVRCPDDHQPGPPQAAQVVESTRLVGPAQHRDLRPTAKRPFGVLEQREIPKASFELRRRGLRPLASDIAHRLSI